MNRISLQKTRVLFIIFFLALVIPAGILSYKANEQLRWQSLHQYQLDAQALVQQIDNALREVVEKEEARADTDYTFFVLAGTPEARFVQRSELSKFPVESDIAGVIGYFQIDEKGAFSSPILPSAHVQSAVQPQLYGISVSENRLRNQLEQSVFDILSQNQLVDGRDKDKPQKTVLSESVSASAKASQLEQRSQPEQDDLFDYAEESGQERQPDVEQKTDSEAMVITGSRKVTKVEKPKPKSLFSDKRAISISSKKKQRNTKSSLQEGLQYNIRQNDMKKRKARLEKNYSPQQSLVVEEKSSQRVEQDQIQIKLFESEIEPFRFSLLKSGHFVLYRQVWRNQTRLIQGAVLSSKEFMDTSIKRIFNQSSLAKITHLNVYVSGKLIDSFASTTNRISSISRQVSLRGELLSVISLNEPFGDFSLELKIEQIPTNAGATFINMVAASLLLVLILGCYILYRLTLKQSNLVQQQQDFVSSVSHELKTPLTSIRMYGEILKQGWVSDQKREEYYDYIYSESERLSRLIANVLQISKVSHNALELNLISVAVLELVSLIKSKVDSQIAQSQFSLNISVDPQLDEQALLVDADAFVQIIINLVDNAIKYASKAVKKHIDIRFQLEKNNRVNVSVRDYGPGISKAHIKNVFDLFYRSENELTRETAGTGIGLALVKELVDAMSAKIKVTNHSEGVEFSISFICSD